MRRVPPELEIPFARLTWRDGQRLTARDLGDEVMREGRLRRLHVRHLHDTWGIATGFTVQGEAGDTDVDIGPGYAVDAEGRDILMADAVRLPVPDSPQRRIVVLTAAYRDIRSAPEAASLAERCLGDVLGPLTERPAFTWRDPMELLDRPTIALAQAEIRDGRLLSDLDLRVRRFARPFSRPRMARGVTQGDPWSEWQAGNDVLGLKATIDISEGGFRRAPQVFAALELGDQAGLLPAGFVAEVKAASFEFRVIHGAPPLGVPEHDVERVRKLPIAWLALERSTSCPPSILLARLFAWNGELLRAAANP